MLTIYSKNYCPYCVKAKNLLEELEIKFEEIDITDTPEKIEELEKLSGMQTVPQIFAGEKCLGGYTEIEALYEKGELLKYFQ